ncbi:MAG: hypothetical protein ACRD5Z_22865 [Bryobacteraceae bacterium]
MLANKAKRKANHFIRRQSLWSVLKRNLSASNPSLLIAAGAVEERFPPGAIVGCSNVVPKEALNEKGAVKK